MSKKKNRGGIQNASIKMAETRRLDSLYSYIENKNSPFYALWLYGTDSWVNSTLISQKKVRQLHGTRRFTLYREQKLTVLFFMAP